MKAAAAVAEILKREGVEFLIGYPVNPIIEAAAEADIRTIIVRQERTGLHMADAVSRVTSGERIGVFAMQHGPGTENAFGGVAQAYGDSVPIVVLPGGYPRRITNVPPNFNSLAQLPARHQVVRAGHRWPTPCPDAMRRAFTQVQERPPAPGAGRDSRRRLARGGARAARLHADAAARASAPDPQAVTRGRRACWSRPSGR